MGTTNFKTYIPIHRAYKHKQARNLSNYKIPFPSSHSGFVYIGFISFFTIAFTMLLFSISIVFIYNDKNKLKTTCFKTLQKTNATLNLIATELISTNNLAVKIQARKIALNMKLAAAKLIPNPYASAAAQAAVRIQLKLLSARELTVKLKQLSLLHGGQNFAAQSQIAMHTLIAKTGGAEITSTAVQLNLIQTPLPPTKLNKFTRSYELTPKDTMITLSWRQSTDNFLIDLLQTHRFDKYFSDSCSTYLTQVEGVWTTSLRVDKY